MSKPTLLTDLAQADRFEILIGAVKDYAIYLLDADGRVATWNTGAQLFKGYTADEIIGQHFSRFYTPEDQATGLPSRALKTAREEGRFESEGWRVRKDGTQFWTHVVIDPVIASNGDVIGFAKVTRDVSERRARDLALRESEQRFRLLVQNVHDYAIYMLDLGGHVSNWNAGAQAIKGYTEAEIVGRHFSVFYTPEDREAGLPAQALATALRAGKFEGEAQRVRKNGERFWAQVLIDAIHDDEGRLVGFAKVTRDITERRRAEEELQSSREALLQAQKMEAIGRLTGGVAHDFNNLLTVIRASADFLRRPGLTEEKRIRYTTAIAETAERATVLTSQLLAFSRRQTLQPEVFDMNQRLRGLQQMIMTTIASQVDVAFELDDVAQMVDVDPSQFETAVLNLVINARDAMPGGGTIVLRTRAVTGVPSVRQHVSVTGDFVGLDVIDTGTGMSPETMAQIFEPFFTTKPIDKGTGLGLSQVYGFCKQSRGEVSVQSVLGKGSTFTLYLPRTSSAVRTVESSEGDIPRDVPHRRLLLVEDNQGVGRFAAGLLEELGQTVTWVGDGRAALNALEAGAEHFDLVFSDVVMPGISGIELAKEIRLRWPALQIVLTSGYSHVLAESGTHGYPLLKKPYSVEGLLKILRT